MKKYRKSFPFRSFYPKVATWALVLGLGLGATARGQTTDYYQDFDDWPGAPLPDGTHTNAGWIVKDGRINNNILFMPSASPPNAALLGPHNSYVRSPLLPDGAGSIQFAVRSRRTTVQTYAVQTSPTGAEGSWTTLQTFEHSVLSWTAKTVQIGSYDPVYVRILKTGDGNDSAQFLGLDDIVINLPSSHVAISGITIMPDPPLTETDIEIASHIQPMAMASNIEARVFYTVDPGESFGSFEKSVAMQPGTSNQYTVTLPEQWLQPGLTLRYYLEVEFEGNDPLSPTNAPATEALATLLRSRPFESGYASMQVVGSAGTGMRLVADQLWQGVIVPESPLTDPSFGFASGSEEWGDAEPSGTDLPVYGTAQPDGPWMTVNGEIGHPLAFEFNDTSLAYSIQGAVVTAFGADEGWPAGSETAGTHTNAADWILENGRIMEDAGAVAGYAAVLEGPGQSLRSPELATGVGTLNLWYRNHLSDGAVPAGFAVQTSPTGEPGTWITREGGTVANVLAADYLHLSLNINDPLSHYVRILNADSDSQLRLGEAVVTEPGATVALGGDTRDPEQPVAGQEVTVTLEAVPEQGATGLALEVYYRPEGETEPFVEAMASAGGNTFTATLPGTPLGPVYYWFRCEYSGLNAAPAQYPVGGAADPLVFTNRAATVSISEVGIDPEPPLTDTPVQVSARVEPGPMALIETVRVRYSADPNENRPFAGSALMTQTAGDVYAASLPGWSQPGLTVRYYVEVEFDGPGDESPASEPTEGWLSFMLRQRSFESGHASMQVVGSAVTNMRLVADGVWQGVIVPDTPLTDPSFGFASGAEGWGDADPSGTALPVHGTAQPDGPWMAINGEIGHPLAFEFNDTSLAYSIQGAVVTAFGADEGWPVGSETAGTHTNAADWILENGRIMEDAGAVAGYAAVLESAGQILRSPELTTGVGTLNLWYRNHRSDGSVPAGFAVQTSPTGEPDTWTTRTEGTVTNVLAADYLHLSLNINDPLSHYVRILNADSDSHLRLGEAVVTEPGATVIFQNLEMYPAEPRAGEWVEFFIDVLPVGNATNLTTTLYLSVDGGDPMETAMAKTNHTFFAKIAPLPTGTVEYWFRSDFTGFNAAPAWLWAYAPEVPFSYTVPAAVADERQQDFDDWPGAPEGTYTNAGWIVKDGRINNNVLFMPSASVPNSALLGPHNSYVRSPLLADGAGTLYFAVRGRRSGGQTYYIETSADGELWDHVQTFVHFDNNAWTVNHCVINVYGPVYVRILKVGDGNRSDQFLGLDDIVISPPPADVVIGDPWFSPGYPAVGQPVTVHVAIESLAPHAPAFNMNPAVHYQHESGANGTAAMVQTGEITYAATVPGLPAGAVTYYIEAEFNGFHYQHPGFASESLSPAYSPKTADIDADARHGYAVRMFQSDFEGVRMNLSHDLAPVTMHQLGDRNWQGVIDFGRTSVVDPEISLAGLMRFDGTHYWTDERIWGAEGMTGITIPQAGDLWVDGANLVLSGEQTGQVVIRFNESNLTYTVQRALYQDFDRWPASPVYFEETIWQPGLLATNQNFNHWPVNTPEWHQDDFNAWPLTDTWSDALAPSSIWVRQDSKVTAQVSDGQSPAPRVIRLRDTPNLGAIYSGTPIDGLGRIKLDYRVADQAWLPSAYTPANVWPGSMIQATLQADTIPLNRAGTAVDPSSLGLLARYAGANTFYELRHRQVASNQTALSLVRRKNNVETELGQSVQIDSSRLTDERTLALVTSDQADGSVALEVYLDGQRVLSHIDAASPILTPNPIGLITRDADLAVSRVTGGRAKIQTFRGWPTLSGGNLFYALHDGDLEEDWWIHRGYALQGAAWLELDTGYPTYPSYVQTPPLPHGVGGITLDYRNMAETDAQLTVQWSTNAVSWQNLTDPWTLSPQDGDWVHNVALTDIAPTTSNVWLRLVNTGPSRFRLANISIHPAPAVGLDEDFSDDLAQNWNGNPGWWTVSDGVYRRPGYTAAPLGFEVQIAKATDIGGLPTDSPWQTLAVDGIYVATNTHWLSLDIPVEIPEFQATAGQGVFVRIKHTDTAASLLVDNIGIHDWHGDTLQTDSLGWKATESWVRDESTGAETNRVLELRRSRAYAGIFTQPDTGQYVQSPAMANGLGRLSFRYNSLRGNLDTLAFEILTAEPAFPDIWTLRATVTQTVTSWTDYALTLQLPEDGYVRIRHQSANTKAGLLINDIELTDYVAIGPESWVGYNALITSNQTNRLLDMPGNVKGAYLNNHASIGTDPSEPALGEDDPYIQSAKLSEGIGEISFWYRSWDATPATIKIYTSNDPLAAREEWNPLAEITNITSTVFAYFSTNFYDTGQHYVRIYGDRVGGRVCLENLLIVAPARADLSVKNLRTLPEIPLYTDSVDIEVDIYDFILAPVVTHATLYWREGTSQWGTWEQENPVPMAPVATNEEGVVTYRTQAPIPARGSDTVIQYYVKVAFEGLFSEFSSPKIQRESANPSHYEPVNLNQGQPNPNPHYIVFSSRPGDVWINEVSVWDDGFGQYVELAGVADIEIGNWRLEVYDDNDPSPDLIGVYYVEPADFRIPNAGGSGYGFWVVGHNLTTYTPEKELADYFLPFEGGLRLVRSMGAYEHSICYGEKNWVGHMPALGFTYIGDPYWFFYEPASLSGEGSNLTSFAESDWFRGADTLNPDAWTPGAVNDGQTLLQTSRPVEMIVIENLWLGNNQVHMTVWADVEDWTPTLWYSTNLTATQPWTQVFPLNVQSSNEYRHLTAPAMTDSPVYFYKVSGQ